MLRASSWLPLFILAILAALSWWLTALVDLPEVRPAQRNAQSADGVIREFSAHALDETGRVRYRVSAARALHFPNDDSSELEQVRVDAYRPGQPDLTVTADRGELAEGTDRVTLIKNVVVVRSAGPDSEPLTITSQRVVAFPDDGKITTREHVLAVSPSMRTESQGLDYDHDTRTLKLYRVNSSFPPKKAL